jgi:hypothetical protein
MIRLEEQIVANEVIYHFNHIPKIDFPFHSFLSSVVHYFLGGVTIRYMLDTIKEY